MNCPRFLMTMAICVLLSFFSFMASAQMVPGINSSLFFSGDCSGNDSFTKLMLHLDGTNGSTSFPDSSSSHHTVTPNGNAQISTAQSVFSGSSLLLDGTGDYLTLDGSSDFAFGSGDWTIDFWIRLNSLADQAIFDGRPLATSGFYPTISFASGHFVYITNNVFVITGSVSPTTGVWYHIAVARSGSSTKLFVNGVQDGSTYTDSNSYLNGTSRPVIGAAGTILSAANLNGWLDEIRVSKGIARWTANFTPPSSAYCP